MKHFIIDGNNLIGKMHELRNKDKQFVREKTAFLLERYFSRHKAKVSLHFDGFADLPVKVSGLKIKYSDSKTADEKIKQEIERSVNRKNIILISSDNNLKEFAKVCSCTVKNSEDFLNEIHQSNKQDEESSIIEAMKKDTEEFKKLFGEE